MINFILSSNGHSYTMLDFAAIHRNGRFYKNNRPPSITVKFLRYHDKDWLFTKRYVSARKSNSKYAGVNFHHCLCPGLVAEQTLITRHSRVKFVRFEGGNRYFTVCIKDLSSAGNDMFLNRIQSFIHFEAEFKKL